LVCAGSSDAVKTADLIVSDLVKIEQQYENDLAGAFVMILGHSKMYDVVFKNPRLLLILEFFNIPLGFGDQTVYEICKKYHIDEQLFLTFFHLYCYTETVTIDVGHYGKTEAMMVLDFLTSSHEYFLEEKIPRLKAIIKTKSTKEDDKDTKIIKKFVHDYADEVFDHITYENKIVFPYVRSLLQEPEKDQSYNIEQFKKHHTNIEVKLTDLLNLLIKHVRPEYDNTIRRQLLFELSDLERDIHVHDFIENNLLIPVVKKFET
jgi:regulator of cell morphogenesis and NO signaling